VTWSTAAAPLAASVLGAAAAAAATASPPPQPLSEQVRLTQKRAEPTLPPAPPSAVRRARVLVLQKNESALEFQRNVISAMASDVISTVTGEDAIALLQSEDIQAVIVDDELDGEWPGRKLYGWICEHRPELRDRFMLTVTTTPKPEVKELIDEASLAYVQKPLRTVELFAGVQQLLTGKTNRQIN
jgi:response regulator RpfG family c-di-GMP phosphodiesterase